MNAILAEIAAGPYDENERYSNAPAAQDRAAWPLVQRYAPDKSEKQCPEILRAWLKTGLLYVEDYHSPSRHRGVSGLRVDNAKRPGARLGWRRAS